MKKLFIAPFAFILTVTQNPLIGRARKSIANNVFTTYKGLNVVKSKPLSVANPKTDLQVMYRSAQVQIVDLYKRLVALVKIGFQEAPNPLSPYNQFVSVNRKGAFNYSSPPAATLNYDDLVIAKGSLTPTAITGVVADESAGTIVVSWGTTLEGADQSASDKAYILAIDETTGQIYGQSLGTFMRAAGSASVSSALFEAGDGITAYLFFRSATENKSSDSSKMTVTAIA